ncbi:MAG: SRPBCC domain-containing protein [Methylococcaceae bacterium]|jgi:hypothetical protein
MLEIRTELEIHATPEQIWNILTDFTTYAEWNPFIRSIQGVAEPDKRLKVSIQLGEEKPMQFQPKLLICDTNKELRWSGNVVLPGILDGEHYFQIVPLASAKVCFIQGEIFSGLLMPFFQRKLENGTKAGFVAMNLALQARAELTRAN